MTVEQYRHFVGCDARQDLLVREQRLRSDLGAESNPDRQISLAQGVHQAQRAKFRHEQTCRACLQIENAMAQEGAGPN